MRCRSGVYVAQKHGSRLCGAALCVIPRPGHEGTEHLRPRSREREAAHRADAHFAGHAVAGNRAGEGERQRHRVGDGDFPGDVVAGHGAVEDFAGIAVGGLRAGQRAPALFTASVALRSPIGVLMVIFQFPSTAILVSPTCPSNRNGSGIAANLFRAV